MGSLGADSYVHASVDGTDTKFVARTEGYDARRPGTNLRMKSIQSGSSPSTSSPRSDSVADQLMRRGTVILSGRATTLTARTQRPRERRKPDNQRCGWRWIFSIGLVAPLIIERKCSRVRAPGSIYKTCLFWRRARPMQPSLR